MRGFCLCVHVLFAHAPYRLNGWGVITELDLYADVCVRPLHHHASWGAAGEITRHCCWNSTVALDVASKAMIMCE